MMQQWTLSPNYPILEVDVELDQDAPAALTLRQRPLLPPGTSPSANGTCNESSSAAKGGAGRWWLPVSAKHEGSALLPDPAHWLSMWNCTARMDLGTTFNGNPPKGYALVSRRVRGKVRHKVLLPSSSLTAPRPCTASLHL